LHNLAWTFRYEARELPGLLPETVAGWLETIQEYVRETA